MKIDVTFKNIRPRQELRDRAEVLYGKLERFLDPSSEGRLMVNVEHGDAVLELIVSAHGETHTVEEEDEELRPALDKLFHKMEIRLRRSKEKRTDRHRGQKGDEDGFVVDAP